MRKNKILGFTLIELLAVIVILAIIALIATPIVLDIIDDTKKNSMLRSADFYIDGVELSIATARLNNQNIEDTTYTIMNDGNICLEYDSDNECSNVLKVEVNGEKPNSGKITISEIEITDYQLTYKDKVIVQNNNESVLVYKENNNIEVPDLYNGTLTPVIYDGDNWRVADVNSKWYDYSKQEWANAVILDSSVTKKVGDIVTVEGESPDVLAMLVWIPRYEYKIDGTYGKGGESTALPGEIEVNFIPLSQKEPSTDYRVHQAFTFGAAEISGIWVGKFEVSHVTLTLSSNVTGNNMGCTTEECEISDGLRVLPSVKALRYNNVSSFFYGIRSMSQEGNIFGIDKSITDTHMMKNNEWGAVAYLSQSKYGKYGNSAYSGPDKEVYMNNSTSYYTGRSGGSYGGNTMIKSAYKDMTLEDLTNNMGYYTYDGYLLSYNTNTKTEERDVTKVASTTGNIYGVYDMSGGSWEYTMGVFINSDGALWSGNSVEYNSGFKGKVGTDGTLIEGLELPEEKYYQIYKASDGITINHKTSCNGGICYGDALNETMYWYSDSGGFVSATNPWFERGGRSANGSSAGVFGSYAYDGRASSTNSARVVFSPTT